MVTYSYLSIEKNEKVREKKARESDVEIILQLMIFFANSLNLSLITYFFL